MLKKQIDKIKELVKENWEQLNLLTLLTPLIFAACITGFLLCDRVANSGRFGPNTFKMILENVAFYILVPAVITSYLRFCIERSTFFLWLTAILTSLLCREIHWDWTRSGIFVILSLLMIIGFIFYDKLRPQITSSAFINLFVAAVICYFIASFLLDQNWARIPKTYRSDIRFRKSLEEFMEILGHSTMALIVLLTPAGKKGK